MGIEDLRKKKADLVIEYLKLGMDFDTACVACEVDDEQKEELSSNERFISRANFELARKEGQLLKRLNDAAENNAGLGDTRQLERILEILNPRRYSKVTKLSHTVEGQGGNAKGKVIVEFTQADVKGEQGE